MPKMLDDARKHSHHFNSLLLEKLDRLRQELRNLPSGVHDELHFNVFLQAHVLPICRSIVGVNPEDWRMMTQELDSSISATLSRQQTPQDGIPQIKYPNYFNCAALRRDVWSVYQKPCTAALDYPSSACFHLHILGLLEKLQKQAHKEIRANVLLVVGSRLPAELVEVLYEAALELEEVPLNPEGARGD